jgi:hypothetical protein
MSSLLARAVVGTCASLAFALLTYSLCADLFLPTKTSTRSFATFGGMLLACTAIVVLFKIHAYASSPKTKMLWMAVVWNLALILVIVVSVTAIVVAASVSPGKGTRVGTGPLLYQAAPYQLDNHGRITEVDRKGVLLKTVAGTLGWHLLFISIA